MFDLIDYLFMDIEGAEFGLMNELIGKPPFPRASKILLIQIMIIWF